MKLNEAKKKAVAAFTKNPYWQGVYDRAPEDAKEYLALLFLSSAPEFAVDDEADGKLADALAETEAHLVQESKDYILSVFDKGAAHDIMTRRFRAVAASQTPEVGLPVLNPDFSERETKKPDIAGLSFTWMNNKGIDISKKKSNSIFGLNGASAVATDAADGQDDGAKHITEDEVFNAVEEFIGKPSKDESGNVTWEGGNEYWRDLFMEAPDGARMRLSMTFYFSENHEKPDFPLLEYRAMRKAIEDALDFDSLEYLIANEDNEAAKNHYKDIWKAKMEKEGKDGDDGNTDGDDNSDGADGNNDGGDNSEAQNDGDDDADGNSDANQDGDDDNQDGGDADGDNPGGDGDGEGEGNNADGDGGEEDDEEDEDIGNPDDDPALQQGEDDEDTDENGNAVEMNDDGTFVLASDPDTVAVFNDGERRYSLVDGERKYVDGDDADNAQNADGEGDNNDSSNGDDGDNADNGGSDGGGEGDNADNGGDDAGDDGDEPVLDEEGRECIAIGKGTLVLKDDNEKVAVFKDESGRFSIIDGEPKPIEADGE